MTIVQVFMVWELGKQLLQLYTTEKHKVNTRIQRVDTLSLLCSFYDKYATLPICEKMMIDEIL